LAKRGKLQYDTYRMTRKEKCKYFILGCAYLGIISYFFYRDYRAFVIGSPFLYFFMKGKKQELCKKRKSLLQIQFKEALVSIRGSLLAGYALENAFLEAKKDMTDFYGKDSLIVKELEFVERGLENNKTLEELIFDLGKRSGVEDISDFANVLVIGKRSGGNLGQMLQSTIFVIEDKLALLQEIETLLHSRQTEQKVMRLIPFFMIGYIELTSGGYFSVLYGNPAGVLIMSFCLCLYLAAQVVAKKITAIEV